MTDIQFRAWHKKEKKMFYRAYQKLTHLLLCNDDKGKNGGKGVPVMRAHFEDCTVMEHTTLIDRNGVEIFEGDIVSVRAGSKKFEDIVPDVPDLFRSRKIHPLKALFEKHRITSIPADAEIEVVGNVFQKR